MPEYRLGFAEYVKSHPEVGKALSDERYFAPDLSCQLTENGLLVFAGQSNAIRYLPKRVAPAPPAQGITVHSNPGRTAGTIRSKPRGVLLHGSRSGIDRSTLAEYESTRRYAENSFIPPERGGPYYTGWHITVGDFMYSHHMDADEWGNNVGAESDEWFAIEFAQPRVGRSISDAQVATAAVAIKARFVSRWGQYDWNNPAVFQTHAERPQGIASAKSDTFPRGDLRAEDLKQRLRKALAA